MKPYHVAIACLVPLLLFAEILAINTLTNLLTQPSDMAVLMGVALFCAWLYVNVYVARLFYKVFFKKTKTKTKTKTKNK